MKPRYTEPARPDMRLEDPVALIDTGSITALWKSKRAAFLEALTGLSIDHLACASAIDVMSQQIPLLTNNAASLEVGRLKKSAEEIFTLAYIERVGAVLGIPRETLDKIVTNHTSRVWGPKPPPPVVVGGVSSRAERKYSAALDSGGPDESEAKNRRSIGMAQGFTRRVPMQSNPFGLM